MFNVKYVDALPKQCVFVCVVWILEKTAIFSVYSVKCLVFLTETERVYYAVRNVSLHIIQAYINLRDLYWTKRHCDRFSSEHFSFSLSLSSHKRPVLIFIYISLLPEGQTVKIGKPYRKQCRCGYTGAVDRKILSLSSSLKC